MPLTKRERILTAIVIVIIVLFGWQYFEQNGKEQQNESQLRWSETVTSQEKSAQQSKEKSVQPAVFVVDVKGAVNSPGVYEVTEGERMIDVIRDAGGFTKKADRKQINLAELLKDEMVVYVPVQGETGKQQWSAAAPSSNAEEGKVNINAADAKTLEELPGIGPAKATGIIAYRDEHGPFKTVEDLLDVSGIGEKSLEQLKDKVAF